MEGAGDEPVEALIPLGSDVLLGLARVWRGHVWDGARWKVGRALAQPPPGEVRWVEDGVAEIVEREEDSVGGEFPSGDPLPLPPAGLREELVEARLLELMRREEEWEREHGGIDDSQTDRSLSKDLTLPPPSFESERVVRPIGEVVERSPAPPPPHPTRPIGEVVERSPAPPPPHPTRPIGEVVERSPAPPPPHPTRPIGEVVECPANAIESEPPKPARVSRFLQSRRQR
jgi:hypothetical protein